MTQLKEGNYLPLLLGLRGDPLGGLDLTLEHFHLGGVQGLVLRGLLAALPLGLLGGALRVLHGLAVHGPLHNQRRRRVNNRPGHVIEFRGLAVGLRAALRGARHVLLDGPTRARAHRGIAVAMHEVLCGNDTVTKRPRLSHAARRLSCGRIDGVEAVRSHEDAIAATTSS